MTPASDDKPDFEREKWKMDVQLRKEELALTKSEILSKARELRLNRWVTSVTIMVGIIAGVVAAGGNMGVAYLNAGSERERQTARADADRELEEEKAEATRILEMIKTGDPAKARQNLKLLLDAGLIANPARREKLAQYLNVTPTNEIAVLPSTRSSDIFWANGLPVSTWRCSLNTRSTLASVMGEVRDKLFRGVGESNVKVYNDKAFLIVKYFNSVRGLYDTVGDVSFERDSADNTVITFHSSSGMSAETVALVRASLSEIANRNASSRSCAAM